MAIHRRKPRAMSLKFSPGTGSKTGTDQDGGGKPLFFYDAIYFGDSLT